MSRDVITAPQLVPDMDEDWYHSDPVQGGSLSVSGAKMLLAPSCPAVYQWHRAHPRRPSSEMELGTVVHGMLLGTGQPVAIIGHDNYTTKAAKEAKAAAIAAAKVPMLLHKYVEAEAIAQAVRDDDECGGLLAEGRREESMFTRDPESGIWLRGRTDSNTLFGETPTIVDVKTAADSSPEKFAKSIAEYRYDMQSEWYREMLAALLGCDRDDVDFVFVAVPTSPPFLPMAYRIEDPRDIENARESNRIAREVFRDCTERGVWPKWSRDITPISLPGYSRARIEREIQDWHA